MDVAAVEKDVLVGGAVANTGTLPSKTLRETALALSGIRARELYGVDLSLGREATVAANERARIHQYLDQQHVELILVATGSSPFRPPKFAFADDRICDSDQILHLAPMPKSMLVVGAGVIGSEYACTFAALGVNVHIIDGRDSLLPMLDAEVSSTLLKAMGELGIVFHWKDNVIACDAPKGPGDVTLRLSSGGTLTADTVLVAAGRTSNTEALGLDAPALAATGVEQARVAMSHAFDLGFKSEVSSILPYGIYTIPEVSMAGETEESLREKKIDYVAGTTLYRENARGQIIGEQASELIHVGLATLLMDAGWDLFNRICFNYPTLGVMYQRAAYHAAAEARLHMLTP